MRAKNRLSPYPILSAFSDDYKEGSFNVIYEVNNDYGALNIKVEYALDSVYLKKLIDEGTAVFVTHVECPKTSFRARYVNNKSMEFFSIPIDNVSNIVELNTFIIANDDFLYTSDEFNEAYDEISFNIKKNQMLAIGNSAKVTVANNTRDMESFPSLIKIVKVDTAEKAMSVDTDDDVIKIKLSANVCDSYKSVGNATYRNTAFCMVIFPAMITVLSRMVAGRNTDLSERRWFTVLERKLNDKNILLDNLAVEDGSLMDACQLLFDDPVARAFEELVNFNGVAYED